MAIFHGFEDTVILHLICLNYRNAHTVNPQFKYLEKLHWANTFTYNTQMYVNYFKNKGIEFY